MKKPIIVFLAIAALLAVALILQTQRRFEPDMLPALEKRLTERHVPSVDHSKLDALKRHFSSPQEVTRACLSCHTERGVEVMKSSHWNWERAEYIPGRGIVYLGKKNAMNNYCIGTEGNEQSCAKCHIGYGMTDAKFSFRNADYVDCMACHDNSGKYVKAPEEAGKPDPSVNLTEVAQHVGLPLRTNCGTCHFLGGGGNNVKHGDLEVALFDCTRDVDVHMASDGPDLQCTACHTTKNHQIAGKMYSLSSMNRNRSSCEQCHTASPHKADILNEHTVKVSCQACHIPTYAKVNPTKVFWDWSTAGKLKDGKPYVDESPDGTDSYMSIKGTFTWGKNLRPEYVWFNGTAGHYLLGDRVDTTRPIRMNTLYGSYGDRDSRIIPVKIHRARQIYDPVTKMLIQPKLFDLERGKGAFWKDFDWNKSAAAGMAAAHLPYSGNYSFVRTEMYWPVNHMVAKKEDAVKCAECHTRQGGRLDGLRDFYMPGRDYSAGIETVGTGMAVLSLLGVVIHGSVRVASRKRHR